MRAARSSIRSLFGPPEDDPLLADDASARGTDGTDGGPRGPDAAEGASDYTLHSAYTADASDGASSGADPGGRGDAPVSRRSSRRLSRIEEHVVALSPDAQPASVDALNDALDEGWRLVGMRLATHASGMRAVSVTLRRRRPHSLFDFGG